MKKKLIIAIIFTLFVANPTFADNVSNEFSSYTGDEFFTPPAQRALKEKQNSEAQYADSADDGNDAQAGKSHTHSGTMPPLKKLRIIMKNKQYDRAQQNSQLAPTNPEEIYYNQDSETSEFASKEPEEDFDENMMPDGFEADEQAVQEKAKAKFLKGKKNKKDLANESEKTESIIMDCDDMNYDTNKYCLYAKGNVNVEFVKQKTVVKADIITYDRMNNTIKAEGNVRIIKNGQTITGDYIFVDMNEENALIENPVTESDSIVMRSKRGYVYGDKIVQEEGNITVDKPFPVEFSSTKHGALYNLMMMPKNQSLTNDMEKGLVKVDAKEIKISQNGEHETMRIKRLKVKKGKYTLIKLPAVKFYTNKNHDYVESNIWEIGFIRGLGMYTGPGFVFELPKGSVFKAIPMLNYKSGFGIGAVGRFQSGTNFTQAAYGTAENKFVVHGKQRLDDNLYLQYGVNDFMEEWFLGRRRPKYGVDLVYEKGYSSNNFLIKNHESRFSHRADFGYFQDIDHDRHFKKLNGSEIGTTRTRYMMEVSQNILNFRNEDKLKAFSFDIVGQLSAALYGTGDTQVIGRIGPRAHMQYKRWVQDIGYYQSVYDDHTPMPVFDAYRYGKSNVYVREYFRINKYLTLCWFGSLNLSNDSPNNREFQENAFYISIGPQDFKINLGYDIIRENSYVTLEVKMDTKGTKVDYDKLEIKQDKKAKSEEKLVDKSAQNDFRNSEKAPVLQRAVVEDIKMVEDVL